MLWRLCSPLFLQGEDSAYAEASAFAEATADWTADRQGEGAFKAIQ